MRKSTIAYREVIHSESRSKGAQIMSYAYYEPLYIYIVYAYMYNIIAISICSSYFFAVCKKSP